MTKKIIGLYQLITGLFGVIIVLANFISKDIDIKSAGIFSQIFAGVILFGLLAYTGYGLLNNIKNAVKYSKILQALQIISFTVSGTLYKFSAAAYIAFGIKGGEFTYGIGVQPIDFAMTSISNSSFSLIIYLVPIIILYGLTKIK